MVYFLLEAQWSLNCDLPGNDVSQMTVLSGNITYCLNYCILQGIVSFPSNNASILLKYKIKI